MRVPIRLGDINSETTSASAPEMELETGQAKEEFKDPHRSHRHPQSPPYWNDLKTIHRNTLRPRSHFFLYDTEHDALAGNLSRSRSQLLSGEWKFHLSPSPFEGPQGFYERDFDTSSWAGIQVPGMWQCQGFGKGPQYTNFDFPWPADPPNVPLHDNECGRYWTVFQVEKRFKNALLRLRFEGVDSAFTVWVNGKEIGYSQGARNPSEFDVTDAIEFCCDNTLAVEVYQRCDGSYLEDQDQWWLSGIFRDVYLHSFPRVCVTDFKIETHFDQEFQDAFLYGLMEASLSENSKPRISLRLLDAEDNLVCEEIGGWSGCQFELEIENPHKWTAETPYLYSLVIQISSEEDVFICQKVGFRQTELIGGVFCVNGQPVKLRGVNRHEHHPDSGRAVPYEWLRKDLELMKLHNINAIRTSHYINDIRLYELANELGFWVLDEADLECHGFGILGTDGKSWASDDPNWKEAYVDRAVQMVVRDRNQPCVILWSLGNESFYGQNHQAMYDNIQRYDSTRLIHYEADQDAETADILSRMYTSLEDVACMAREPAWKKPLVMCEFAHAMGNGPGAIREYIETFYEYPRLMGGFVWEWANHGLTKRNEDGENFMAYGGDFGDDPNDGNFVLDGLCFSNHTPKPGLVEYKKAIEPVQTLGIRGNLVTIVNRYDFLTLDHLRCSWRVVSDGNVKEGGEVPIPQGIKPHTRATIVLDNFELFLPVESYLTLSFAFRQPPAWAPDDHEVAFGQLPLGRPTSLDSWRAIAVPRKLFSHVKLTETYKLAITGHDGCEWVFDLRLGALTSWKRRGHAENLITEPMSFAVYRAPTDNDRLSWMGDEWQEGFVRQAKTHVVHSTWKEKKNGMLEITVASRIAPPVLNWSIMAFTTVNFSGKDVSIRICTKPQGLSAPSTLPRLGLKMGLAGVEKVRWFGRGPGESYRDKKLSQRFGNWENTVDGLFVDYEYPQDGGSRTDVRWVEFVGKPSKPKPGRAVAGDRLLRARFGGLEGASFQAMHYTAEDLDASRHPYELRRRKREDTIVTLDFMHHGLGTGSCGPLTLPQYELSMDQEYSFEIVLD